MGRRTKGYDWTILPAEPGVYSMYPMCELLYIGSSKNIRDRVRHHLYYADYVDPAAIESVRILFIPERAARMATEQFLIWKWRPRFNRDVAGKHFRGYDWVKSQGLHLGINGHWGKMLHLSRIN